MRVRGAPIFDCPALEANIGDACDDNDANTENDVVNAGCVCAGTSIFDCPVLEANIGDACNDNNATTINDVVTASCVCAGTPTGCTENPTLAIKLDAFGSQTTWTPEEPDTQAVVDQGGPYTNGTRRPDDHREHLRARGLLPPGGDGRRRQRYHQRWLRAA